MLARLAPPGHIIARFGRTWVGVSTFTLLPVVMEVGHLFLGRGAVATLGIPLAVSRTPPKVLEVFARV